MAWRALWRSSSVSHVAALAYHRPGWPQWRAGVRAGRGGRVEYPGRAGNIAAARGGDGVSYVGAAQRGNMATTNGRFPWRRGMRMGRRRGRPSKRAWRGGCGGGAGGT